MPSPTPAPLRLQPHPSTPCPAVAELWVALAAAPAGALSLRYQMRGALDRLRLPDPAPAPAATDGLWRHSCFEAFVGAAHGAAYREFNFAPSGHWASYAFDTERVRSAAPPPAAAPAIHTARLGDTFTLSATVAAILPAPALLGLCAVLETLDGQLSYWALAHPRPVPDFHARAGWTARLPPALVTGPAA